MKQEIKERIELINKGIVPAGYKKTSVGICPVEWIETILGKICEINPKTERLKSTFQYIDLESIVNGKVVAIKMINKQNAPSRAQRVLSKNDIIYQLVRPYQKNNFLLKNINENYKVDYNDDYTVFSIYYDEATNNKIISRFASIGFIGKSIYIALVKLTTTLNIQNNIVNINTK